MGWVPSFRSWDGTELVYRVVGDGPPLVCVPGGPGQAVRYLGELGGLSATRTLILLDNRGTGESPVPADPATYRVDRIADDVEALRAHLGLPTMDLFGHSASGGVCFLYADAHPQRLRRLVIVDPSLRVLGLPSDLDVAHVLAERSHEPWIDEAAAALTAEAADDEDLERLRRLSAPLLYGPWNDAAKAQAAAEPAEFAKPATDGFYAGYEPDPALPDRLAESAVPTLLVVGEHDIWPTRHAVRALAERLSSARLTVQPASGHFPWVDDPRTFAATVESFLSEAAAAA
ncbi:hydrolase [Catellatospora citrea]|uniref:Hydrolase n=1 Tax=Catellatospora citrea TaxID=53366 RepID=A0A8J3K9C1_9ACTN|nr:pimeloyl-ACP methyl ester carboxylesterase [Catellatospora citrea]GIF94928.1 hydrolase [Catellatospora citrea]